MSFAKRGGRLASRSAGTGVALVPGTLESQFFVWEVLSTQIAAWGESTRKLTAVAPATSP